MSGQSVCEQQTKYLKMFEIIYERNIYFILSNVASIICILVATPLLYSIVWFERYGSTKSRTLVNMVTIV